MTEDETLAALVRRIVEAAHPKRIILFGSRARGTARPDSDYDLMVVEEKITDRVREMARLDEALSPLRLPSDILVVREEDFQRRSRRPGNVYFEAAHEGKVLHESR